MLVPIACRFIAYDQWFVTHLDDSWKVKQVKLWFLSKCSLVQSIGPYTHRSVSPITFAPSVRSSSSLDSLDDGYNEDDEFSDQDLSPRTPVKRSTVYPSLDVKPVFSSPTIQPGSSPLVDRYILLSFSTGSTLEDEFPLSWYHLRPYELLEMHPVGTIAPLRRDVLAEYIQPYFHAKVKILRITWSHRSGRFEPPGMDGHKAKDKLSKSEKRRKIRAEWKTRWVVINHGFLSLCKEHATNPPVQQFSLSSLSALRGADALERAFSIVIEPRVVCIKFRQPSAPQTGMASPPPSSPSSPILESNVQEPIPSPDSTSTLKERGDPSNACKGDGDWVVLDMLDDHAFSSILRILHRQAFEPISSSFVPSSSIIAVSPNTISSPVAASSSAPYETIPYPEWRIHTVENARKAGMGDVGKPMAWILWTDKGLGESLLGNIRYHRQAFSQEMQYKTCAIATDIYGTDEENDDDSEMEWEGWVRDLERQSRVKQRSAKAGKAAAHKAHPPSSGSGPLPSPPLSEASPTGSPRVGSPSLSMSQLAPGSFGTHSHGQYPNIGNVIQTSGTSGYGPTEFPHSSDWVKTTRISTVTVGMAPSPRRRSTTLSSEATMTTRLERDKGRLDGEALPRAIGTSTGTRCFPSAPLRHARSSSNLRVSSSTSYGPDAWESSGHPRPSSPPKRQSTFMRGVTQRAGKIVRGLESAIDFVDEKTTV